MVGCDDDDADDEDDNDADGDDDEEDDDDGEDADADVSSSHRRLIISSLFSLARLSVYAKYALYLGGKHPSPQ